MPYIGRGPSKSGAFRILKDFSASFDGSETTFAIQDVNGTALSISSPQTLMIAVDGVLQEPGSAYTISGTNIVFGSAPQDSATFWGVELGDIGGTSVSSSDQILVVATGHSFVVGRWMKVTSTDGVYAYADCTTEANAEVAGVIISTTTDTYTLQVHGTVTGDAVPAQASGTIMFLDASNGQMTTTETSTAGRVSKPLAIVTKNDSEMVILTYRGEVISSNVQTNAPNDATYVTTTANSTLTNEVLTSSLKIDDFAAGDDNTDLDSSTSRHGLLLKLGGGTTNFLRADGTWNAPSGGAALTGSTNNTVTTVTGANAITGEANLTFDGTNLTVGTGNVIIGTAGKGIDFSVNTQSAVSGAAMVSEVLDWYEEGTWTPIAKDHDGGTMSQQSNGDEGKYTRIGNTVYIQCRVICNGNGSATTSKTLTIHGLPFTHQNATNLQAHPHVGFAAATANPSATVSYGSLIEPGNSFINIMSWDVTTGQSNTVVSEFSHDGQLGITGHYFVS